MWAAIALIIGPVCSVAIAQEYAGRIVREVNLEGLERVSPSLARGQIEVQPGEPYSPRASARDLSRLHNMGYFSTVRVEAEPVDDEVAVTYIFEEKRMIREIQIIGNDRVRETHIRGALTWREGDSFAEEAFEEEREAILNVYEERGFPAPRVEISAEEIGPGELRLTYAIEEGPRARISRIDFVGNETLSDRYLRRLIETSRAWWFLGGRYDENQFEADLRLIERTYANYGHLEAEVVGTEFDYTEAGNRMHITVYIEEGPAYHVERLAVEGNIVYEDDEIMGIIEVLPTAVHNRSQVQADADLIAQGYSDSGYVDAEVTPLVTIDPDTKTTNVVHRIHEGDLKYVREIRITGNEVTRDDVIRRHLHIRPGERFDGSMIRLSQRELENTNFFDDVRFSLEPIEDDPRFENIVLELEEARTGEFGFGAGYSPDDGIGGYTDLRLRNFDIANPPTFAGGGQEFNARVHIGERRTEYNVGFTDPEIFGYPLAGGFDVFQQSVRYRGGIDFREDMRGAQVRIGKVLSPHVTTRGSLRYRYIDISDLPFRASRQLRRERGDTTTISAAWGISRDTLDRRFDPTGGARHEFNIEVAGLGGDNHFFKLDHDSEWFWGVGDEDRFVLSFRTREGYVQEYGPSDFVPLSDRYFAGGTTTVRGYRNRDISPRERRFGFFGDFDAVGGNLRLINNAEVKYRLHERLRLYTFVDAGGVWADTSDFDLGEMRFGAGVGLGVDVPRLGPVRLDYGHPVNPDRHQTSSGRFHFQTGLRF